MQGTPCRSALFQLGIKGNCFARKSGVYLTTLVGHLFDDYATMVHAPSVTYVPRIKRIRLYTISPSAISIMWCAVLF